MMQSVIDPTPHLTRELRRPTSSPPLTLVEQAEGAAARVTEYLREASRP